MAKSAGAGLVKIGVALAATLVAVGVVSGLVKDATNAGAFSGSKASGGTGSNPYDGSRSGSGSGGCPFITGSRYVFKSGSPPAWTVVWRGKSVYTSGVQGLAENKYNDLCAADPY